eukprot:g2589.t1
MTFVADKKYFDVRMELLSRGWQDCPILSSRAFDLKWRNARNIDFSTLLSDQFVNHFDNSKAISVKRHFCFQIRTANSVESFYPKCWALDDPADMHCFLRDVALSFAKCILKRCLADTAIINASPALVKCITLCERLGVPSTRVGDLVSASSDFSLVINLFREGTSVDELWSKISNAETSNCNLRLNRNALIERMKECDVKWQGWSSAGKHGAWIAK